MVRIWRVMENPESQMSLDCVVLNGTVVTSGDVGRYDIGIKNGKIAVLAEAGSLINIPTTRLIDAQGAYVTVRYPVQDTSVCGCQNLLTIHAYLAWRSRCPRSSGRASNLWERTKCRRLC
jgi:hypothetical protein